MEVWSKGTTYTFEEAYKLFSEAGHFSLLNKGGRSLVITGGDPLLQQEAIAEFFAFCADRGERVGNWSIEVENQGSLMPKPEFSQYVSQWNISPKMSNSGMPKEKRIVPAVIKKLKSFNSYFKFPIYGEEDMPEVLDYVNTFEISKSRVSLMPLCSTREAHVRVSHRVAEICMREGFVFCPRLQLVIWDKAVGV